MSAHWYFDGAPAPSAHVNFQTNTLGHGLLFTSRSRAMEYRRRYMLPVGLFHPRRLGGKHGLSRVAAEFLAICYGRGYRYCQVNPPTEPVSLEEIVLDYLTVPVHANPLQFTQEWLQGVAVLHPAPPGFLSPYPTTSLTSEEVMAALPLGLRLPPSQRM